MIEYTGTNQRKILINLIPRKQVYYKTAGVLSADQHLQRSTHLFSLRQGLLLQGDDNDKDNDDDAKDDDDDNAWLRKVLTSTISIFNHTN